MRQYEAMYIIDPQLEEDQQTALVERFQGLVRDNGGEIKHLDRWERRRLAYEVKGRREGYYVVMNFTGEPAVEAELGRVFGITDAVIRHLITKMDPRHAERAIKDAKAQQIAQAEAREKAKVEAEARQAELEAAQAAAAAAAAARAAAAPVAAPPAAAEAPTAEAPAASETPVEAAAGTEEAPAENQVEAAAEPASEETGGEAAEETAEAAAETPADEAPTQGEAEETGS